MTTLSIVTRGLLSPPSSGGGDVYYLEPMDSLYVDFNSLELSVGFDEVSLELSIEEVTELVVDKNQEELNLETMSNDLYIE